MPNKLKLVSLILLIQVLFSSCGSIINLKQKVTIKSNVDSASVYINENFIGVTPIVDKKVSVRKSKTLRIQKAGFKDFGEIKLEKKVRILPITLNVIAGSAITTSLVYAFKDKFIQGVTIAGACAGFPFTLIDYHATGALFKLKKREYNLTLHKIPARNNVPTLLMNCSDFSIKINPGTNIGTNIVNKKSKSTLTWNQTNNIQNKDFIVFINNELNNIGYNVSGLGLNKSKNTMSRLRIEVELDKLDMIVEKTEIKGTINQYGTVLSEPVDEYNSIGLRTPLHWKLINNSEEVVFEYVSEVNITRFSPDDLNMALFDAVQVSLYDFIAQPNFIKHTTVDSQIPTTNATYSELIIQKVTDLKGKQTDILNYCKDAVVTIESDYGTGSGFVISNEGFIVTNKHVVEKNKMVNVIFSNGFTLIGEVIRINENLDLALIKVKGSGFKPIEISRDKSQEVGTDVYAIGAPLGKQLQQTVTKGIISGQRLIDGNKYIQTDVVINQGNSGGPLINKEGKVVGMVVSKIISNGVEGIGFCIPAEVILDGLNLIYSK